MIVCKEKLKGCVTDDMVEAWISYKTEKEVKPRLVPYNFMLYFVEREKRRQ